MVTILWGLGTQLRRVPAHFNHPLLTTIFVTARYAERGYATVCPLSVRLSVRDVQVCFSHKLEYVGNNFMAEYLKVPAHIDSNISNLAQREQWNMGGVRSTKSCNISETVRDRTKVIMTDQ